MRRIPLLVLVLAISCARMSWEGDRTLSRDVQAAPDSLMLIAAQTLREHGYDVRMVEDGSIVTAPKAIPQYSRPVSTAPDTMPSKWVLQLRVSPNTIRSGSRLSVTGFLVPRASERATDTTQARATVPVTSDQPELFRELERVGNWIVESVAARRSP